MNDVVSLKMNIGILKTGWIFVVAKELNVIVSASIKHSPA